MKSFSIFLLEFNPISGPQIIIQIGDIKINENESESLKCCSFPDIAVQSEHDSIFFIFKISNFFCYTIFSTKIDKNASRGFRQHSIVILTELPYTYIFTRLLHSTLVLGDINPQEIIFFLNDFINKWFLNFPNKAGDKVELPMFDSTLPISITENHEILLSFYGGVDWSPLCKIYYLNSHFLGIDLVNVLSIQSLINQGRSFDILQLWESSIIDDNILVYGSNPSIVSQACLAISSLTFPEPIKDNILPFLSVTDSRFQQIIKEKSLKGQIIGVSNPIALMKSENFSKIFITGFLNEKNGLNNSLFQWNLLKNINNNTTFELRKIFYNNNLKLINSITNYLNNLRIENPYAEFLGQINQESLEKFIQLNDIILFHSIKYFTNKLLRSSFFIKIWKRRCSLNTLYQQLLNFNIENLCKNKLEHELVDLISSIGEIKKQFIDNSKILSLIDRDLQILIKYLPSDLIISPNIC